MPTIVNVVKDLCSRSGVYIVYGQMSDSSVEELFRLKKFSGLRVVKSHYIGKTLADAKKYWEENAKDN